MHIIGLSVVTIGFGREFERKDKTKVKPRVARCIDLLGEDDNVGAARFFDIEMKSPEMEKAFNAVKGKRLTLAVKDMRQPFSGAPISLEDAKILKAE